MNYKEFSRKIKEKYPEYNDMDDKELALKMINKYPNEYSDVEFDTKPVRAKNNINKSMLDEILFTPRGKVIDLIPFVLPEATPFTTASRLGRLGNFATTMGYQGGIAGGLNSLENKGDLSGVAPGALTSLAIGSGLNLGGKGVSKTLPYIWNGTKYLSKSALKGLTGLTPDTIKQSIKPNSNALELTPDSAQQLLMNTTERVRDAYNNLLANRGQAVRNAVDNLKNNKTRIQLNDLENDITDTFNSYGAGNINPARTSTGDLENTLINNLRQGKDKDFTTLQEKFSNKNILNRTFNKEKEQEAISILAQAINKHPDWVRMQIKGGTPLNDFINRELERVGEDKLAIYGLKGNKYYPLDNLLDDTTNETIGKYRNVIDNAYNDLKNNNFYETPTDELSQVMFNNQLKYNDEANNLLNSARQSDDYSQFYNYANMLDNKLPDDMTGYYLNQALDDAENIANLDSISPIELQKYKEGLGRAKKQLWADGRSQSYDAPILEQIYGKYNQRLSNLSPEIAQANKNYSDIVKFEKNEGLKRILKPGDNIDTASSALKNYNNTITKGNVGRNVQDLESTLVENGYEPFLNDINDVNASQNLNNITSTGKNVLGAETLAKESIKPVLKGIRELNRKDIIRPLANIVNNIKDIGYGTARGLAKVLRLYTPPLQGYITNDEDFQ